MSDDKSKVGGPDRQRVAANEPYEVDHVAKKHGVPASEVKKTVEEEGPMRKDVEKKLENTKESGQK